MAFAVLLGSIDECSPQEDVSGGRLLATVLENVFLLFRVVACVITCSTKLPHLT